MFQMPPTAVTFAPVAGGCFGALTDVLTFSIVRKMFDKILEGGIAMCLARNRKVTFR